MNILLDRLIDLCRYKIKWPLTKAIKGYEPWETWELDAALVEFMLPRLKAFKRMPRSTAFVGKKEKDLDAMIWSFEHWKESFTIEQFYKENKFDEQRYLEFKKKLDKGFTIFGKGWRQLCD